METGLDAHLDLHTQAGQAWVSVHVRLRHAEDQRHQGNYFKSRNSLQEGTLKKLLKILHQMKALAI